MPTAERLAERADIDAYLDEARAVGKMKHPNIVQVFDVGSTAQCPVFVVFEYIDATDLRHRMQSRQPPAEAAELVATLAEALAHAHQQDLYHRDIKPENILIDKQGKAYVMDFGLALREEKVGTGSRYAGTVPYMSPEQVRGESHRVDGRSDIFSLGVVLRRSSPRDSVPSTNTTPISSWNFCQARETATACPTASASGKPASNKPTRTKPLRSA